MVPSSGGPFLGAVELGGSKVLCAVGRAHDEIVAEHRIETRDPSSTLAEVEDFFESYRGRLRAIGIASFGPLELDRAQASWGSLLRTPKAGWSGTPLTSRLAGRFGVPVDIDTDVNAAALAEQRWGAGQGVDPCVYITVGTGVGVGVVIEGRSLQGLMHPELGHVRAADLCSFPGVCPFHGRCIEGVATAPALRARTGIAPEALRDDDPVWMLEAAYLGQLVTLCVLAYSPRRIVLGGGVLERVGLLSRVRAEVLRNLGDYVPRAELSVVGMESFVVAPALGPRAGLAGAFLLAGRCAS
ncbi:MAG: ROK family protein [Myxococcales bacterium]